MPGLLSGGAVFLLVGSAFGGVPYEQRVIAAIITAEASNQGREGLVAVAEVIRQRVKESGWTPLRVVAHGNRNGIHAFSVLNQTTLPALVKKWYRHPAYGTALELARLVCEAPEQLPDTTLSANFFTRVGEKPQWARGRKPVIVINNHAFYRIAANPGARRAW